MILASLIWFFFENQGADQRQNFAVFSIKNHKNCRGLPISLSSYNISYVNLSICEELAHTSMVIIGYVKWNSWHHSTGLVLPDLNSP